MPWEERVVFHTGLSARMVARWSAVHVCYRQAELPHCSVRDLVVDLLRRLLVGAGYSSPCVGRKSFGRMGSRTFSFFFHVWPSLLRMKVLSIGKHGLRRVVLK